MKQVNGIWLPDFENYLIPELEVGPLFAGKGTVQFKKFARAFPEIKNWHHAIDVGSNYGIWTRVLARCFKRVTCFEPNSLCHEAFYANFDPSAGSNVILYDEALGDQSDKVMLDQASEKTTVFGRLSKSGVPVVMNTLDSFEFDDVDFIKIDVEGWEHNVIKGARRTIKRCKPIIIIEQKPGNAELHGLKQFGARNLLIKMGMRVAAEISGDIIMVW